MGPEGEAGYAQGLMHVICSWHGGNGPPGFPQGVAPHFIFDPYAGPQSVLNWTYVGSISSSALGGAGEPTPVYEPSSGGGLGIPGDNSTVRRFIARQSRGRGLTIGLYNLT